MPLTNEQAQQIKGQLLNQIKKLPEHQRAAAQKYIQSLSNEQLEKFLVQNRLIKSREQPSQKQDIKCIFCAIAAKQIQAFAIYDDKDYIAVLEIKPFSKGHAVLVPKKHIKQTKSLPSRAFTLANKIGRHIARKLKAETFQINTSAEMGHAIVNIIPVYKGEPLTYERKQAKTQELQELAIKISEVTKKTAPKPKALKISKAKTGQAVIKLSRRIP